jgi:hypothetical protein
MSSDSPLHQFPYAPGLSYDNEARDKVAGSVFPCQCFSTQGLDKMVAAAPLPTISPLHLPRGYRNYKPPLLHCGWSFVPKALLEWGVANGVNITRKFQNGPDEPDVEEPNSLWTVTQPAVLNDLAKKAGTPHLRPTFKLSVRSKGCRLITISTNYSFLKDKKYISRKDIETFGQYLKERGIVEDAPGWHLDHEHYMWRRIY